MKRVLTVLGTRPEAIKLAPVLELFADSSTLTSTLVSSAQQQHLVDQALEPFGLRPDVDLRIRRTDGSLQELTAVVVSALAPVLAEVGPDIVLVQGDTTTTFVAALAAFYAQIPVVHLEAGLRTDDPTAPFPEEINRRLTTELARLHLAPTASAAANLQRGGVRREAIVVTGNTVIDALHAVAQRDLPVIDPRLNGIEDDPRRLVLVTAHRRESWAIMPRLGEALARLATERPDIRLLLPLHPNPVVRDALAGRLRGLDNVVLTDPLGYTDFVRVLGCCHLALTDSGGVQEEGPSLGKPVLVMRDVTERPEAIAAGTARLVGTSPDHIVNEVVRLLDDEAAYNSMANAVNPYGDGKAAPRAVAAIEHFFGLGTRPDEFQPELAFLDKT